MNKPLSSMKILDFTYLLPGPFGTMMLADMGADIIKVENSTNPDLTRYMPPLVEGVSALYLHLNRGKKSLSLNLKQKDAVDVIRRLVGRYDIVVEQFRPGTLDRLGIGYEDLKKINESIIFCSLTGYGQTGSYADRAGHDINYLALSGVESFSGKKECGPVLSGIQIADIASGSKNLVMGVLTAYIKRLEGGGGDYIDVSMTDGVFSMSVFTTAGCLHDSRGPLRESEMLNGGVLYDYYGTSDGRYLSVGPIEQKFFAAFCEVIGCPDVKEKGIINTEAKKMVADIIAGKPLEYWNEKFREVDACVEPVLDLQEAIARPPLSERDMVVQVTTAAGKSVRQIGNPIKFRSGHYYAEVAGVPMGHHNNEILKGIGYSSEEIEKMKKSGAAGG